MMQACLREHMSAKTDWATDFPEMKRSGIEGVRRTKEQCGEYLHISGGDALKGHTRSHPEHDG